MASGLAMSVCMQKAMASMRVGWGRGQVAPNTATAGRTAARGVVKETKAYMLWMGGRGVALGKRPCSVTMQSTRSRQTTQPTRILIAHRPRDRVTYMRHPSCWVSLGRGRSHRGSAPQAAGRVRRHDMRSILAARAAARLAGGASVVFGCMVREV